MNPQGRLNYFSNNMVHLFLKSFVGSLYLLLCAGKKGKEISLSFPPLNLEKFCPEEDIKTPEKHSASVYVEMVFKM